jgi:hypothetical protein
MSKKVELFLEKTIDKKLKVKINIKDKELFGKDAYLKLYSYVEVIDSRPVNDSKKLYKKKFIIDEFEKLFIIDLKKYRVFSYN